MIVHDKLMLRTPLFPMDASLEEVWEPLLDAIRQAAPDFHRLVAGLTPETLAQQPERIRHTVIKYFNRSKFRCPPLGTFSAFGTADITDTPGGGITILGRCVHRLVDWRDHRRFSYAFADVVERDYKLFANSTYYRVGDAIRYVQRKGESFELAEVGHDPMVLAILGALRAPLPLSRLLAALSAQSAEQAMPDLIEAMIGCGLLLTEADPNLVGTDYFSRVRYAPAGNGTGYLISELAMGNAAVPAERFRHVPELVALLTRALPQVTDSTHLTDFISRYAARFDRQHIPVMRALDPEIGVGYGDLHQGGHASEVIAALLSNLDDGGQRPEGPLKAKLRQGLGWPIGETISLDDLVGSVADGKTASKLPNTLSVVASIVDSHLVVERIGGHSANQLAGRFTVCSEGVRGLCRGLVDIEERANPDVVLFDIAYRAEHAVDNINRRDRIYRDELPLLTYTELDEPLALDDLFISVSGDGIVLRSERLGKRVVPRMASAYNYRRSRLPVFRFLYDLAFYRTWSDLSFDIAQLMPGMRYYPRVRFRDILLSMARVTVHRAELADLDPAGRPGWLLGVLDRYRLGRRVKVVRGEEPTVFDTGSAVETGLLIQELLRTDETIIEEYIQPKEALVKDTAGRAYANQLIIPLVHHETVYHPSAAVIHDISDIRRSFMPGEEWLYAEIFCHPGRADALLLDAVRPVIERHAACISCWFFIRYAENGHHLRLRIRCGRYQAEILSGLKGALQPYRDSGIVTDLAVRMYQRELERYDVVGIEAVESLFQQDSLMALAAMAHGQPDIEKYLHCLRLFEGIAKAGPIGDPRFRKWTGHIRDMLQDEHRVGKTQHKAVNAYINRQRQRIAAAGSMANTRDEDEYISIACGLLSRCPGQRQAPLMTDLLHMHVNRLFGEHQRTHELVIYSLLVATGNTARHRANATSRPAGASR